MYTLASQLSQQIRSIYFDDDNWVETNLQAQLQTLTWQQATTPVAPFSNTIATTFYHLHFYINRLVQRIGGSTPPPTDYDSFAHPPISSQTEWQQLLDTAYQQAEQLTQLVAHMPDQQLLGIPPHLKNMSYYTNISDVVQHVYYHFAQIMMLKKLITTTTNNA